VASGPGPDQVPAALRPNIVVIGSIATAWQFRDVSGTATVATKDIDLLLRPSVDAVATAQTLGHELLEQGWKPQFPNGIQPGKPDTPDNQLPVLRLNPPRDHGLWFVELLAEPPPGQKERKQWTRFHTASGDFALPSFRYMRVAVHGAEETEFGLRVARPACMALAHLLEHADPDRTPISSLPGQPPRFIKDVGRAISIWWLAREQSSVADKQWSAEWTETLKGIFPGHQNELIGSAKRGLNTVADYLREAHAIAISGVLAPHQTTLSSWRRAFAGLGELVDQCAGTQLRERHE
jgi:hypothetical protein